MFKKKNPLLRYAMMASVLSLPSYINAQENEEDLDAAIEDSFILEELIVTARKRQELLQETPVAVSALNDLSIQSSGMEDLRGLQGQVPSLTFNEQGSKNPSIFIRGIGQRESNALLDPGVGVYINGVYLSRTDAQIFDSVDLDSVQVLRGPQGTLFGKNSPGGAILVKTKPAVFDEFSGYVSTRAGNFGRKDAKLGLNFPLVEGTAAARLNIATINSDGYLFNVVDGKHYGEDNRDSATLRVNWILGDNANMDIFAYYGKQDERGAPFSCYAVGNPQAQLQNAVIPNGTSPSYGAACARSEQLDHDQIAINDPSKFEMTSKMLSTTFDWSISEDWEMTSITAFSQQDDILINDDQDGTDISLVNAGGQVSNTVLAANGIQVPDDQERSQFTQEFQFNWTGWDDRINLTTGVFFSKEEVKNGVFSQLTGANGYQVIFAPFGGNTLPVTAPFFNSHVFDFTIESKAVFSQISVDFTDWFQLTFGARYTSETRDQTSRLYAEDVRAIARNFPGGAVTTNELGAMLQGNLAALGINPAVLGNNIPAYIGALQTILSGASPGGAAAAAGANIALSQIPAGGSIVSNAALMTNGQIAPQSLSSLQVRQEALSERKKTFNKPTFNLTAAFTIPDNLLNDSTDLAMVYTSVSTGFKAGGFEFRGNGLQQYNEEEVLNFEIGTKIDALDNRLRFNAAIFQMNYEDLQIRVSEANPSDPGNLINVIDNAGEVTIQGFEAELTWIIENLDLRFGASILDASYDEFNTTVVQQTATGAANVQADRSDEPFPGVEQQYFFSSTYHFDLADGSRISPRLGWVYQGENYTGIDAGADRYDRSTINDYLVYNFRISYDPGFTDAFKVAAFVDNITDEEYFQGGYTVVGNLGASARIKAPLRTWGFEATYNF